MRSTVDRQLDYWASADTGKGARSGVFVGGRAIASALSNNENFSRYGSSEGVGASGFSAAARNVAGLEHRPFLRIPPFPKARINTFAGAQRNCGRGEGLVELLREAKVGGAYWAAQPSLPHRYCLVLEPEAIDLTASLGDPVVLWASDFSPSIREPALFVTGEYDPWHMLGGATMLVAKPEDELCMVASILGVPTYRFHPSSSTLVPIDLDSRVAVSGALSSTYQNPFTGQPMSVREAIALCGFWRRLIDQNREIVGGVGFAFWKQDHVAPLLWSGDQPMRFFRRAREVDRPGTVAVWRAKVGSTEIAALEQANVPVVEVEDGFLRSNGLGADCVPPLSITVDRLGPHFDPTGPSELELLLEEGEFNQGLLDRAARIRETVVDAGLGKYERSNAVESKLPSGSRRRILVPGQVEDDRAVQRGGCGLVSNLELLARVRARAPEAYILYKPHPDVLAGHRRGAISDRECLQYADEIVTTGAISFFIGFVDEIHVNTSLAGFEALLRDKPVTTYGVPFYAGWGLTRDLGPVPERRTARRTLDELVAAALLVYPRYLDPVTGLPCPAEVVVERLTCGPNAQPGLLVRLRRLQGKLVGRLRRFVA